MNRERPLISVVVPAYNAADTLGQTIASVLDQTHRSLEVLVVDDGSTDATADVIARAGAADPRVVPVSYGGNRGRSAARNAGIDASSGDWIAMVDADDLIAPDRFERFLAAAGRFSGANLITDDRIGWRIDESGVVRVEHRFPGRHTWRVGEPRPLDARRHFTDKFGHIDLMVSRGFLRSTGIRYPDDLAIGEDLYVDNALLFHPDCRPVRVARPTYYYRLGPTARAGGAVAGFGDMVARVDRPELTKLYHRWGPAQSWLFSREDGKLADAGRIAEEQPTNAAWVAPPSALYGVPNLLAVKALQWAGRSSDRSLRPALVADITTQLSRSV